MEKKLLRMLLHLSSQDRIQDTVTNILEMEISTLCCKLENLLKDCITPPVNTVVVDAALEMAVQRIANDLRSR